MFADDEGVDSGIGLRRDGFCRGVGGGAVRENGVCPFVLAATDFREDHPQFTSALSAHPCVRRGLSLPYWSRRPTGGGYAQSRFHLTPSETAAILAESVAR